MKHRDRSDRHRLQETLGELGHIQQYRQRLEDPEHSLIGWWVTPAPPSSACACELCYAGSEGLDLHLGSITRTAQYEAGRLVNGHVAQQRSAYVHAR